MKRVVIDGLRYYAAPGGRLVPSVTTVLNATANRRVLDLWEKKLGVDEANRRRKNAQDRGVRVHENMEAMVQKLPLPHPNERYWGDGIEELLRSFDIISSPFTEYRVYHPLGFAGTGDLFYETKEGWHYLDAKSSNKRKDPDRQPWVVDHFFQAAAYIAAFYKQAKHRCIDATILVCLPNNEYQVLKRDKSEVLDDWHEFKKRLKKFSNERMVFQWSTFGKM